MGSTGLSNKPTSSSDKYTVFNSYEGSQKWMANPKLTNSVEWQKGLTGEEMNAIGSYTGSGYGGINTELYTKPWDEMSPSMKQKAAALYEAINKFELKKGITITRQCDSKIFGHKGMSLEQIKNAITKNGGYIQNDGFMSFGTNDHGVAIAGSGVIISLKVPPSKGAVAYVNPISTHKGSSENETIVNSNSVLKFDASSIKQVGNKVYVEAEWVGQAKQQTIDPKNKSKYSKKKQK